MSFWTPKPLKSTPQDTQKILQGISQNVNLKHIIEFFHLCIIHMTLYKDIMPYFDIKICTCLWLKSEYIVFPLYNSDAPKFYNRQFWAPSF